MEAPHHLCLLVSLLALFAAATVAAASKAAAPSPAEQQQQTACIVAARGRGAGEPLQSCAAGKEKNGLLCYNPCKHGYAGAGPVCWRSCSSDGMVDLGTLCARSYGKGCCCTAFGCCHNKCKPGFKDMGCICRMVEAKKSYGRGAGEPMKCGGDKEEDAGLCYKACDSGFSGQGPVCWESAAAPGFPVKCNLMLWGKDQQTCDSVNSSLKQLTTWSAACISLAVAVAAGGAPLAPLSGLLCGKSFDSLVNQVQQVIQSTHAKRCHA